MIEIFGFDTQHHEYRPDLPLEDLASHLANPNLQLWVNFETPTQDEIQVLSSVFHLDPLAIEDCIHPRQSPKLETYADYLFFIVHGAEPPRNEHGWGIQRMDLHGFLSERYLITYSNTVNPSIRNSKKRFADGKSSIEKGCTYLAHEILDQMVDQYMPVLDYFDDKLETLEITLGKKRFTDTTAMRYLAFSRQLLDIRRSSLKNQEVFSHLSHSELQFIDSKERRLFKDIYDHVVRVVDMSEYYQLAIRSILEIHLSLSSNRVNQVVQFLTVIATITLPLYIIAGLYGMNFEYIPLSKSPYGFYIISGVMLAMTFAMLWGFRKRGWI